MPFAGEQVTETRAPIGKASMAAAAPFIGTNSNVRSAMSARRCARTVADSDETELFLRNAMSPLSADYYTCCSVL